MPREFRSLGPRGFRTFRINGGDFGSCVCSRVSNVDVLALWVCQFFIQRVPILNFSKPGHRRNPQPQTSTSPNCNQLRPPKLK